MENDVTLRYACAKLLESRGYVVDQLPDYQGVLELFEGGAEDLLVSDYAGPSAPSQQPLTS